MPDRSNVMTQTQRHTQVLQIGGGRGDNNTIPFKFVVEKLLKLERRGYGPQSTKKKKRMKR